jgi:hypothetical protein
MSMSDQAPGGTPDDSDALLSRLRVIEDQPLERRAEAFVQLHEELRATLEGDSAVGSAQHPR